MHHGNIASWINLIQNNTMHYANLGLMRAQESYGPLFGFKTQYKIGEVFLHTCRHDVQTRPFQIDCSWYK